MSKVVEQTTHAGEMLFEYASCVKAFGSLPTIIVHPRSQSEETSHQYLQNMNAVIQTSQPTEHQRVHAG